MCIVSDWASLLPRFLAYIYAQCTLRYLCIRSVFSLSTFWGNAGFNCTQFQKYLTKINVQSTVSVLACAVSLSAVDICIPDIVSVPAVSVGMMVSLFWCCHLYGRFLSCCCWHPQCCSNLCCWWPPCCWRIPYLSPCCCKLFRNFTDQAKLTKLISVCVHCNPFRLN